jgi:hypothetical protein
VKLYVQRGASSILALCPASSTNTLGQELFQLRGSKSGLISQRVRLAWQMRITAASANEALDAKRRNAPRQLSVPASVL